MTTTRNATQDLTALTPAQIDALWFPLMDAEAVAEQRVDQWEQAAARTTVDYQRARYEDWAAGARREAAKAHAEQAPYRAEAARRGGWTRAYLAVTNGRGHVHSTMSCSTCNNGQTRTSFARLPEVSGLDTAEIIDLAGERACTVCYPGAPVNVLQQATRLFSKDEIKAKAEREAKVTAKAAKDAKRVAAAIANEDGSPLIGPHGKWDEIKTERTAWTTVVDLRLNAIAYGYTAHVDAQTRIAAALAAKLGKTMDEIEDEINAKVAAKAKREGVTP